ncbi:hypothetical protein [Phenylobacterium sp.]|uniref:hypothetical protein n=1 Tax=Phenylobacterium sp. TaxID=1871053 RepID=UPI00398353D5
MRRDLALSAARPVRKGASSIACLAFVILLAAAFWAGAVWIGQALMKIGVSGL